MSGTEDADEIGQHKSPYTAKHTIPTIQKFEKEKEARQAEARQFDGDKDGVAPEQRAGNSVPSASEGLQLEQQSNGVQHQQQRAGASPDDGTEHNINDENMQPAVDTSEATSTTADPKARRKELKQRKDERAEREVTDPVTHLKINIHDRTSDALKEVPENEEPFGTTQRTATGLSNKTKTSQQLRDEGKELQADYDSMQTLFPPPGVDVMKQELTHVYTRGITIGLVGIVISVAIEIGLGSYLTVHFLSGPEPPRPLVALAIWVWPALTALVIIGAIIVGVRHWVAKRIDRVWTDEIWAAKAKQDGLSHGTETVAWLNSLLRSVWPLINPDLFTSLSDTLEDVMQASLPRVVQMVSVNDLGQGTQAVRILGVRWLPSGAAARSVTEDGELKDPGDSSSHSNDRKVSGQGQVDDQSGQSTQKTDDGSQQQVAEGLEAEEGDFINMEVAFAYRAQAKRKSLKDRAKDMHLYIAFYLPGNIKVPVWVDLRGIVGTMRMRLQLCPDPPFFSLCTITFLGQPKVDINCTPISRHALNIMDVPMISGFVQSAVDAAMAEYVAPKSLNLDLKDLLAGDDFKKDTIARGVLVVNIKRGYDFKTGDSAIPLVKSASSDPYVSVGWAKFGKPVWSTRLLLNEMEPWWDETAYLLVTPSELNVQERLRLQLWDSDRLTADDDLGRIEVDLKEIMTRSESNSRMWSRSDGFRALKAGNTLPGKLDWSVGYFSKTRLQDDQLQHQTFDTSIRSMDQLKQKVDDLCNRKLREAHVKEGRHTRDADELDQQRAQELKSQQDAMIISAPPPDGYPSGMLSIQIHQITGLELEKISKTQQDKAAESADEAEEGEDLPSAYCTIIINHNKVFKSRTKPKNAKPFYNAGTERYIPDWRNAEVYVAVRDARVKEDDALLGIVHLPLWEAFKERSQVNGFYPISGGIGFGRIRISMVWRSIQLQAEPKALGWDYGTLEVHPSVSAKDLPANLKDLKLKFHTDLGRAKMYPTSGDEQSWQSKRQQSLKIPVRKRYSSCLAIEFRQHKTFSDSTAAFAVFWLKEIPDEEEQEITLSVFTGDFERARKNNLPEPGEKVGSITLKVTFWNGLGAAHSKWASKDANVGEVAEVLETARDNDETMEHEQEAGIVDGDASDSSESEEDDDDGDDADDDADKGNNDGDGQSDGKANPIKSIQGIKEHNKNLNKRNRGLMQWKVPRTAKWIVGKVESTEAKVEGLFKHHTKSQGVETEI